MVAGRIHQALVMGAGVTPFGFRASATSTNTQITVPATAKTDDMAVLINFSMNDSGDPCAPAGSPANVVPAGWSSPTNSTVAAAAGGGTAAGRSTVSYKKLLVTDPGTALTIMNGNSTNNAVMLVFSPGKAAPTLTPSSWGHQITENDPTLQTVSASGQPPPLVVFGHSGKFAGTAAFSTESPAFGATVSASADLKVGYTVYSSSPSDHSVDASDTPDNNMNVLGSGYIRIS